MLYTMMKNKNKSFTNNSIFSEIKEGCRSWYMWPWSQEKNQNNNMPFVNIKLLAKVKAGKTMIKSHIKFPKGSIAFNLTIPTIQWK